METPCLCSSKGHKHGGRKVTETSVTEFCYLKRKVVAQELLHLERNVSSSASTVHLAKTCKSDNSTRNSLPGSQFSFHATQKRGNSNVLCYVQ